MYKLFHRIKTTYKNLYTVQEYTNKMCGILQELHYLCALQKRTLFHFFENS